jgi:hypothetical protein
MDFTEFKDDYDSPWKDILEGYFPEFTAFFFPTIHAQIDWTKGHEFLDTQLQQITREAETGHRYADKLVQVWWQNGQQSCIYIHIEIQSQRETGFEKRMFTYYHRLVDRFDAPIVSLALLADDDPNWRPSHYQTSLGGTTLTFAFSIAKLLDWTENPAALDESNNPFAEVVLAHLATQQSRNNLNQRKTLKLNLVKRLYNRGYERQTIIDLLRFLDWLLYLPPELATGFWQDFRTFQQETTMPYTLGIERIVRAEALEEAHEKNRLRLARTAMRQLQRLLKLDAIPEAILPAVEQLSFDDLEQLSEDLLDFQALPDLLEWLWIVDDQPQPDAVLLVLTGSFGELDNNTQNQVAALSIPDLQSLAQAILSWSGPQNLQQWLVTQADH